MSLEDLRDNYKTSRSSKRNIQLNGVTFRQKLDGMGDKALIKKINNNHSNPHDYDEIESLNARYGLTMSNSDYSLNKKKRWELVKTLKSNMGQFNEDDLDIRVYETEISKKGSSRLIDLARSKNDKIEIKKTYANLDSIKQQEKIDYINKINPKEAPAKKVNRFKVKNFKPEPKMPEKLVIYDKNFNEDKKIETDHIEYEIEYEPKTRIVKHGPNLDRDPVFNKKKSYKKYINVDDELDNLEDIDYQSDEEQDEDEEIRDQRESTIEITLNELIENFSKNLIKKHENTIKKLDTDEVKEKKIYIERQISVRENQTNILISQFCEPIESSLEIFNNSIKQDELKQEYGLNYNEGIEYSPRRFNLNLSDQVKAKLAHKRFSNKLNLIVWLRFKQVLDVDETSFYNVSICANLSDRRSISIDNINQCEPHELKTIVQKAIELISNLPDESFKLKDEAKGAIGTIGIKEKLPTITGSNQVKTLDELKLEMINSQKFQRSKSIEVVREANLEDTKLDQIDNETKMECVLCYDVKNVNNECTILTKCGHCVCNDCMKYYVDSRLVNALANSGRFPCPSCSNELEISLLINFASNANLLDVYLRLTVEKVWFVLNNYQWCKANCSNVLKIDMESSPYGIISCTCGYKACLKCNNPPHFPLSCKNSTNYYKDLSKLDPTLASNITQNDDYIYSSKGKRCPNCTTYIEKEYGCNQMYCSRCNKHFCWNCVKTWDEHLKLNNGGHNCKEKEDTDFVLIDFIGKPKRSQNKSKKKEYEDSLFHRNMRTSVSAKTYSKIIQNLIDTIEFQETNEKNSSLSKTENLIEQLKSINKNRAETRLFLEDMVSFVNELHFICEHGLVSIRDKNLNNETRNSISLIIRQLEVLIWRFKYNLEYGNGIHSINEIKSLYARGIKLIKLLNNIKA